MKDEIHTLLPPLIQPANSQNGGFTYLEEKTLQRILKIAWSEHFAHTIPPAPIGQSASVSGGFFLGIGLALALVEVLFPIIFGA